jgi:hypothetical protein
MEATPRPTVNSPTGIRRPEPTPARTPTPIFSKPLVVETPAYTPTREVISGAPAPTPVATPRPSRATVRENSTWNAPVTQPAVSAPSYNNAPSRRSTVIESAPAAPAAPVYNRPNVEIRREERPVRSSCGNPQRRSRATRRQPRASPRLNQPRAPATRRRPPPQCAPRGIATRRSARLSLVLSHAPNRGRIPGAVRAIAESRQHLSYHKGNHEGIRTRAGHRSGLVELSPTALPPQSPTSISPRLKPPTVTTRTSPSSASKAGSAMATATTAW